MNKNHPGNWGTGYKPYITKYNGVLGAKVPEREINLKKTLSLKLGARALKELDDENHEVIYSPLGSIVAGVLTEDEEFRYIEFDQQSNSITHDFRWGRQGLGSQLGKMECIEDPKEAQRQMLSVFIKDKLIVLREEEYDLADEAGIKTGAF